MPPTPIDEVEGDEEYASEEDSDFAPETVRRDESASEDSEDDIEESKDAKRKSIKRKREQDAEDVGYDNSGDEAIIGKGLKKSKRSKKGADDNDDSGEGGFVQTRAMKAAAGPEDRKKLVSTEGATVDVDALWASMVKAPLRLSAANIRGEPETLSANEEASIPSALEPVDEEPDMITIERTYNFAGKVHSESKTVSRHSAEAKLYLASRASGEAAKSQESVSDAALTQIRRPIARRSIYEPVIESSVPRTDLRFKVGSYVPVARDVPAAKKLNTVEKSKMDWAGFVDKEGIKDDLETAAKSKGTYLDNQDFLLRAEGRREEESRRARLKGLA